MMDGDISDDDVEEEEGGKEGEDEAWFSKGMTREENLEALRPWRNNVIIKLIGRSIGYHFHYRRIQAMWRTQDEPLLIDLGFDFFIVKFSKREEFEQALTEGPWMIGDKNLHVQR